jgi:hypothetical protein
MVCRHCLNAGINYRAICLILSELELQQSQIKNIQEIKQESGLKTRDLFIYIYIYKILVHSLSYH